MSIEVGAILDGKVTGITKFGAFVDIGEGKSGLVHISEVSNDYVENIEDVVKKGDTVKVKVTAIQDGGKISLSMRKAVPGNEEKANKKHTFEKKVQAKPFRKVEKSEENVSDFDKMMKNWMQNSQERIASARRNTEGKRGGRGGRRS